MDFYVNLYLYGHDYESRFIRDGDSFDASKIIKSVLLWIFCKYFYMSYAFYASLRF